MSIANKDLFKLVDKKRNLPSYKFPDKNFENYKTINVMNGRYPIDMILKVIDPKLDSESNEEINYGGVVLITLNKKMVSSLFGYFKAMYNKDSNWSETDESKSEKISEFGNLPMTTLKDFDPDIVVEYFTSVFNDSLKVSTQNCIEFYKLANYLDDDYGQENIVLVIKENCLSEKNVIDIYLKIERTFDIEAGCLEWINKNCDKFIEHINLDLQSAELLLCRSLDETDFKSVWNLFNKCELDFKFLRRFLLGWIIESYGQSCIALLFSESSNHRDRYASNQPEKELIPTTLPKSNSASNKIFPLLSNLDLSKILKDGDLADDRVRFFHSFRTVLKSGKDFMKVYDLIVGNSEFKQFGIESVSSETKSSSEKNNAAVVYSLYSIILLIIIYKIKNKIIKKMVSNKQIVGGVVGAGVALAAAPVILSAVGFTAGGVAAGSVAAGVQSLVYGAFTTGIFSGVQSVSAAGLATSTKVVVAAGGGCIGSWFTKK